MSAADKAVTEREAVLRERAAFERGVGELWIQPAITSTPETVRAHDEAFSRAAKNYPLPKVTRPRVVKDPNGAAHRWTVRDGSICPSVHWSPNDLLTLEKITPERVKLWADLLANPTEDVDE